MRAPHEQHEQPPQRWFTKQSSGVDGGKKVVVIVVVGSILFNENIIKESKLQPASHFNCQSFIKLSPPARLWRSLFAKDCWVVNGREGVERGSCSEAQRYLSPKKP